VDAVDYELEYNNRLRVPEYVAIAGGWRAASAAYRDTAHGELDQSYATGERHRYDLFFSGVTGAPLVVYIHGGYWQWGDRTANAFIAQALNAGGIDVVLPSYSLCPTVFVMDIVGELRRCLTAIWARTRTHPLVVGHSAGGHLAAAMVATDWSTVAGVPTDLVRAVITISGLFDLRPLVATSMNDALRLDGESARVASPRLWRVPPPHRTLVAVVGETESSEFRRQSRDIVDYWGRGGVRTEYLEITGANHFTVLEALALPGSELFVRVVNMARQVQTSPSPAPKLG